MRLLVFIGRGADVRVPPLRDPRSGRVREEWLVDEVDPASARALDLALGLKFSRPDVEVTVVHLGPPQAETWLRRALARGCDRAVRVWDGEAAAAAEYGSEGGAAEAGPGGRAVILAVAAAVLGFDLVLVGDQGVLGCDGRFGPLLAAELGVPCVTRVLTASMEAAPESGDLRLELSRGVDEGFMELVEARPPVVLTVGAAQAGPETSPPPLTVGALLAARGRDIPVWGLADLGVPRERVRAADQALVVGPARPRRPRLRPVAAPDRSLPAFERILKLVEGSVRYREGRVVRRPAADAAEEIFLTLRGEGWLDHLRPAGPGRRPPAPPVAEGGGGPGTDGDPA
jgi:electron transfer flavoprotein beta subunit